MTFGGFSVDPVTAGGRHVVTSPLPALPARKIEFLGDSITAGYCNACHDGHSSDNFNPDMGDNAESFVNSWPTQICDTLGAQCHTTAWSGLGLVANCCGFPRAEEAAASGGRGGPLGDGSHLMPAIFHRTLATDGDTRWEWSNWIPDALVINLGTNDGASARTPEYLAAYIDLVTEAFANYGPQLHVFLACGPMSDAVSSQRNLPSLHLFFVASSRLK